LLAGARWDRAGCREHLVGSRRLGGGSGRRVLTEQQDRPHPEAGLRTVKQGRGLTRYKDTQELFDKLGL
jgi:hypothetical protein